MNPIKELRDRLRAISHRGSTGEISLERPQNEYYETVSARFGVAQVALYLFLFAFVIFSFFRNTNLITYENFYHFFKDLNASAQTVDLRGAESVSYPMDTEQSFALYREGLAVAGSDSVTVFTSSGRQAVSRTLDHYRNPVAVGSGKYLLVYELGGTRYSLYNFYARIHTGSAEQPIRAAAVSDSGAYALISSSEQYDSVVSLYDDRSKLVNRYNKNGYVMDVDINARGDLVAIATSNAVGGAFSTELELFEPGKSEHRASVTLTDTLALDCMFLGNSNVALLHSNGIAFMSGNGEILKNHGLEGGTVGKISSDGERLAVCLTPASVSEQNTVAVFDKTGKTVYHQAVTETVLQSAICGDRLYLLHGEGVLCIHLQSGTVTSLACDTKDRVLLAPSEREAVLCSAQKAVYLRFD